jgi:hypothetical protein
MENIIKVKRYFVDDEIEINLSELAAMQPVAKVGNLTSSLVDQFKYYYEQAEGFKDEILNAVSDLEFSTSFGFIERDLRAMYDFIEKQTKNEDGDYEIMDSSFLNTIYEMQFQIVQLAKMFELMKKYQKTVQCIHLTKHGILL